MVSAFSEINRGIFLLGSVDGQPFNVIYTLLPTTKKID